MSKKSKRLSQALTLITKELYTLDEALQFMVEYKELCKAKFDETVEVVFKLGVDPKRSDQVVRGSIAMPHGLGKTLQVAVFTRPERFEEAKQAGADIVGGEELIEKVKSNGVTFDACLATPDIMPKLAILGKILGPKGLMPNPRIGTVSENIVEAIKKVKSGQVEYKVEKAGLIHAGIGKLSFDSSSLKDNIKALYNAILAAKPTASKGIYMQKACLSISQGPSIVLDMSSLT